MASENCTRALVQFSQSVETNQHVGKACFALFDYASAFESSVYESLNPTCINQVLLNKIARQLTHTEVPAFFLWSICIR